LRIILDYDKLQFYYSNNGNDWNKIGPVLDSSKLLDEYGRCEQFTGAFMGICAQDLDRQKSFADFEYFEYKET
jgi:xylan 1,4-beta-xylosidase